MSVVSFPKICERNIPVFISVLDNDEIEFSFSSEYPCERWWGTEILSHDDGAINLERLSGMNFLWNHNVDTVLGKVAHIEARDGRGCCRVKWSKKDSVKEYKQDVEDGILTNVSVRYSIDEIKEIKRGDVPEYRVTRWTPHEVSLVSIPADPSVGIGRSLEESTNGGIQLSELEIRERAIGDERTRIATINALSAKHGHPELAIALIESGKSIDEARTAYLDKISCRPQEPVAQAVNPLGFSQKEQRQYSILKAINASITGDWSKAGFERECSMAVAKRSGLEPKGFFVPVRDLKIEQRAPYAVGASATGGATVETDLLSENFIDILRNSTVVARRATMLSGLQGNIAIPKQATTSNTYWVAENEDITESEATFSQIAMTPKTVAARSQYSRLFLLQSTIDAEQFIRRDFAAVIGIAIDLACIAGTGANGQPTGILNTAGINSVALGTNGGAPTWAAIVNMLKELHVDNAPMNSVAWVTNPQVKAKLMTTSKQASGVEGNFILGEPGNSLLGYGLEVSNQIPANLTKGSGTNLSSILVGNWSDLLIGEWGVLDILASPFGSGFNKGAVDIRVMQTLDLAVRYPQSFCVISDVITT